MNATDAAIPFRRIADKLRSADVLFGNLECCLCAPPSLQSAATEGFFADPQTAAEALRLGGFHAVGIANNVNYGAANIMNSIAWLDRIGILHTGAGANLGAAKAPAIIERDGLRVGFVQRSSVYWPTDHEAHNDAPGIAVIRGHTAYQIPAGRLHPGMPPANRPGVPPVIITWADPDYLGAFRKDIEAVRGGADLLVASCHWGLGREPLAYMTEIARAAIDAGADMVIGHGPHYPLPIEFYRGRPICYGLGNLSFTTGHGGRKHTNWIGLLVEVTLRDKSEKTFNLRFVRHNDANETIFRRPAEEADTLADLTARSAKLGAQLIAGDDHVAFKS